MQLIRCTKKLQKEIGLKAADLVGQEQAPGLLGPWHANLLTIDRPNVFYSLMTRPCLTSSVLA